jgi:hypothetical protein
MAKPSYNEQRVHPRDLVRRRGVVIDSLTGQSYRCIIVDISRGGAQLELVARELPEQALALLDPDGGATHDLRIVWRAGIRVGVAFITTTEAP